jgi:hypothetical protein
MATVKIRILVDELTNVLTQFDVIKVYRSDLIDGIYTEITTVLTRVPLVAGTTVYEYIDTTAPTSSYWYRTAYFHSSTLLESSMSPPVQGMDAGLYCSIQDIRDEGITDTELSDDRAISLIRGWQAWLEKATGNFFVAKDAIVDFDGDGSRLLQLPIPIISVNNLYINDDFDNAVDVNNYKVYNARGPVSDDRRNPRIKLTLTGRTTSVYQFNKGAGGKFIVGDLNQRVDGTWGYTEADGSTPEPICRAVKILVIATAEFLGDGELDQLKFGKVIEEVTDRHRIEYADLYNRLGGWYPTGIAEVDNVISMYRAPTRVTAPRPMGLFTVNV